MDRHINKISITAGFIAIVSLLFGCVACGVNNEDKKEAAAGRDSKAETTSHPDSAVGKQELKGLETAGRQQTPLTPVNNDTTQSAMSPGDSISGRPATPGGLQGRISGRQIEIPEGFSIREIDDAILARIRGLSFKEGSPVGLEDLRYLTVLHHTPTGGVERGELICHKQIAPDLIEIFSELYRAQFPIESMRLVDDYGGDDEKSMEANNTSCFNVRKVEDSKNLSKHAYGLAIDVNPRINPMVKKAGKDVSPENGREFADRSVSNPMIITRGNLCHRLFTSHGFKWGGDWKSMKDYQHFYKEPKSLGLK